TLLENIEYFKASFDNANIGACLVTMDGSFIKVNDELCRLTGYSRDELAKLKFNDITHPEDREIGLISIRKILANEISQTSFEKRYIHKSGKIVWVKVSTSGVRNAKGEMQYCVTYVQDITEEKNAEEIIRESEANLKSAQRYAHIGSWVWDVKANHLKWSDEMFNIFGIEKESFSGNLQEVIANAIHPDDREKVEESNRSVVELGKPIPLEYRVIRPDGSIRYVWAEAGELILDDKGAFSILKGTVQDITYRKLIEQSLFESEERYRLVDESSQDLIYSYDRQSRFTHANSSMCKLMGLKLEEIIGKTHEELGFPQEQYDEWAKLHKQVYLKNSTVIAETITPIQGGAPMYFEVVLNPIHDSKGAIIGIAGTTRDINARKQAELKVNEQLEELKRWYEVTLNRESRIMELKHEVNQLLIEEQKPIRYPSAEEDTAK
ncbi:PAS domain S-box protein, partial [bacterium]|nr:PAS domain S-box protein [bacterium]